MEQQPSVKVLAHSVLIINALQTTWNGIHSVLSELAASGSFCYQLAVCEN